LFFIGFLLFRQKHIRVKVDDIKKKVASAGECWCCININRAAVAAAAAAMKGDGRR
jgi:hypothetical protein